MRFFTVLFIALLFQSLPALAAHNVGTVRKISGEVTVTRAGENKARALKVDDGISENDTIETAKDSRVKIEFIDNTELILSENGKLVIDAYVYDPDKAGESKARISILHAAFSYVSGLIDKGNKADVTLHLAYGDIGIRGTELMAAMKKGELWVYLKTGKVSVYNKGGEVTLNSGDGTTMKNRETAPATPHVWKTREIKWVRSKVTGHDIEW